MKTTSKWFCATLASAALAVQAADAPPKDSPQPAAQSAEAKAPATDPAVPATSKANDNLPVATGTNANNGTNGNSDEVRMNFQDASLETVLKYLSEAAGFIINVKPGTS